MNVYRSGDQNQRKPVLKPLSAGNKRRSDQQPTEIQPNTHKTNQSQQFPTTASTEPLSHNPGEGTSWSPAAHFQSLVAKLPNIKPSAAVINRSVNVPIWVVSVLVLALVAGPSLTLLHQRDAGETQQESVADTNITESTSNPTEGDEELPLALELDTEFDVRQWAEPPRPSVSKREQYQIEQGLDPDREVRYAAEEVERLQEELEAIQRNSAMLRSLARQQSGDLSEAYSSLELSQEDADGALEDLQARIDELEGRIQSIDELARELRNLLDLPPSESGMGGPADVPEDANPWQVLRADVVAIEQRAGELVFALDEVNTEIQLRVARAEQARIEAEAQARAEAEARAQAEAEAQAQAQMPSGSSLGEGIEFSDTMPMGWPVEGPITSRFGTRNSPFAGEGGSPEMHTGIDIAARSGTPVIATGGGTVQLAGDNGGYGLLVVIDHGRGVTSWYGHNSRLLVSPGQRVNSGDVVAEVGSTGRSTGPHVHYEVRTNGIPQDPLPYMQMQR